MGANALIKSIKVVLFYLVSHNCKLMDTTFSPHHYQRSLSHANPTKSLKGDVANQLCIISIWVVYANHVKLFACTQSTEVGSRETFTQTVKVLLKYESQSCLLSISCLKCFQKQILIYC